MKSILILILFVIIVSCDKKSDCYKCTTTFNVTQRDSAESVSWSVSDTKTLCDMTVDKIREYEVNNSDTSVYANGGVVTITIYTTKCTQ